MLTIMLHGSVFNIQKYSLHDGPGIRTTVFLKGCPLQCWWCHNPEGMSPDPEILVAEGRCTACGRCRDACPHDEARPGDRDATSLQCRAAGLHSLRGLRRGLSHPGPAASRSADDRCDEVVAEIEKDQIFYDDSGGGVTFSGGEPFAQTPFLLELLEACRRREIHTAVDTTGFVGRDALLAAARWTNLFLYDIKILDDARHRQYTGVSNASILENLKLLGREHGNIWVRVPIVPGLNDADERPGGHRPLRRLGAGSQASQPAHVSPYGGL